MYIEENLNYYKMFVILAETVKLSYKDVSYIIKNLQYYIINKLKLLEIIR